jgi:hypothetical protein
MEHYIISMGRDSAVGVETRYGLDGPGIESRWWQGLRIRPDRPWSPQWAPGISRGVKRPMRGVDHPLHLAPRLKKE